MPYNLSIRGWMGEVELKILEKWALQVPAGGTIVEVGSLHGRSAVCFAATARSAKIHCFDLWDGWVEPEDERFSTEVRNENGYPLPGQVNTLANFLANTKEWSNIVATQVTSIADIKWPAEETVDLFFLDTAHVNPVDWEYIEFWLPRVRKGGYVAGHDLFADGSMPDVQENVERLELLLNKKAETFNPTSTLWRIQK